MGAGTQTSCSFHCQPPCRCREGSGRSPQWLCFALLHRPDHKTAGAPCPDPTPASMEGRGASQARRGATVLGWQRSPGRGLPNGLHNILSREVVASQPQSRPALPSTARTRAREGERRARSRGRGGVASPRRTAATAVPVPAGPDGRCSPKSGLGPAGEIPLDPGSVPASRTQPRDGQREKNTGLGPPALHILPLRNLHEGTVGADPNVTARPSRQNCGPDLAGLEWGREVCAFRGPSRQFWEPRGRSPGTGPPEHPHSPGWR